MMQPEDRKIGKTGLDGTPAEFKPFKSLDVWEFCRQRKSFETTVGLAGATQLFGRLTSDDETSIEGSGATTGEHAAVDEAAHVDGMQSALTQAMHHATEPLISWKFIGHCDRDGRCSFQMVGRFTAYQECLRCGEPVSQTLEFDRLLRICKSEQEADTLETDENEDAVAAPGKIDALQWLEDEMLLCMPMFPAHEDCEAGIEAAPAEVDGVSAGESPDETHRPFERLAGLLKGKHG